MTISKFVGHITNHKSSQPLLDTGSGPPAGSSPTFTLLRFSSTWFRVLLASDPPIGGHTIRACFHCASARLIAQFRRQQELTGSFFNRHDITPCRLVYLLAISFRYSLGPSGVLFCYSLTVLVHYREII